MGQWPVGHWVGQGLSCSARGRGVPGEPFAILPPLPPPLFKDWPPSPPPVPPPLNGGSPANLHRLLANRRWPL